MFCGNWLYKSVETSRKSVIDRLFAKNISGYIIKEGGHLALLYAIYYRSLNGRETEKRKVIFQDLKQ